MKNSKIKKIVGYVVGAIILIPLLIGIITAIANSFEPASFKEYRTIAGVEDTRKVCSTPLPFVEQDCGVQIFIGKSATDQSISEIVNKFDNRGDAGKIGWMSIRYRTNAQESIADNPIVSIDITDSSSASIKSLATFKKAVQNSERGITLQPSNNTYKVGLRGESNTRSEVCNLIDEYNLPDVSSINVGFLIVDKSVNNRAGAVKLCGSLAKENSDLFDGWISLKSWTYTGPHKGKDVIEVDNANKSDSNYKNVQSEVLQAIKPVAELYGYPVAYRERDALRYL